MSDLIKTIDERIADTEEMFGNRYREKAFLTALRTLAAAMEEIENPDGEGFFITKSDGERALVANYNLLAWRMDRATDALAVALKELEGT